MAIKAELRQDRAWWAYNDPVAYLWLRRAERRGALVPWTPGETGEKKGKGK